MTTYYLQMPISERTRCMKQTEIVGKLNMSLGRRYTGFLTANWIGEVAVAFGVTGTQRGS
jgi:hypothetical protein